MTGFRHRRERMGDVSNWNSRSTAVALLSILLPLSGVRAQSAPPARQISGHVYRSDTGAVVPNAVVCLIPGWPGENVGMARTARDGSYSFKGVVVRDFCHVTAWSHTLDPAEQQAQRSGGLVGDVYVPGEKIPDHVDLHLSQAPEISQMPEVVQMNDGPLGVTYPDKRDGVSFGTGRFSPDGRYFAFTVGSVFTASSPEQAWRYDMNSQQLVAITGKPMPSPWGWIEDLQWVSNTVYVKSGSSLPVTASDAKVVSELPPAAKKLASQREPGGAAAGSFRFAVGRPCHGCDYEVWVRLDGRSRRVLRLSRPDVVADPDQPILFYDDQLSSKRALGSFDLRTRRSRNHPLPLGSEISLLAAKRLPNGFVVAYSTRGNCAAWANPDACWQPPFRAFDPHDQASHVCFIRLPDPM